jgi:hypothetical protein
MQVVFRIDRHAERHHRIDNTSAERLVIAPHGPGLFDVVDKRVEQ